MTTAMCASTDASVRPATRGAVASPYPQSPTIDAQAPITAAAPIDQPRWGWITDAEAPL